MIEIFCKNNAQRVQVPFGATIHQLAQQFNVQLPYPILGALVNNQVRELEYRVHKHSHVQFFDMTSQYGFEMYRRTMYFVMHKAVLELFPGAKLQILHSIAGGKYCEIEHLNQEITPALLQQLSTKMENIIALKEPIHHKYQLTELLAEDYQEQGAEVKAELYRESTNLFSAVYTMGEVANYYYGPLLPNTGYITAFLLEPYHQGILLKMPSMQHPNSVGETKAMDKLFSVFKEFKHWNQLVGIPYIVDLNRKVKAKNIQDVILQSEALQEKKWGNIADQIKERQSKVVLISGPSSSGKTTSCKRLSVHLSILGYHPVQISVDDFFVERDQTPRDAEGNFDFEAIEAIDLTLFNKVISELLEGKEVALPTFNFAKGTKEWLGKKIQMQGNSIIVLEGIHCLNPRLTELVPDDTKYKIFVSALTSLSIDHQNPISTSDNRLIRRMVRDYHYRGSSAVDTLRRWKSVRAGEMKNIFPYQENADVMFNTSLLYEIGVYIPYALPMLMQVPQNEVEYAEAKRLMNFLHYFEPIHESMIPGTSILREFVGGSKFSY